MYVDMMPPKGSAIGLVVYPLTMVGDNNNQGFGRDRLFAKPLHKRAELIIDIRYFRSVGGGRPTLWSIFRTWVIGIVRLVKMNPPKEPLFAGLRDPFAQII